MKKELPGRESNPGLPRDRRRYLPLYYLGMLTSSYNNYQSQSESSIVRYIT